MAARTGARVRIAAASIWACLVLVSPMLPAVTPAEALSVRVASHGARTQPVIALTFDDGIGPQNCRRILAILVEQRVPATFFPIAEAMSLDPAFWRLVADVGDPVGDHTFSHPQLPTLSLAAQESEIDRGRIVAEAILGRPLLRVLRPPYGAYNDATLTAAAHAGFGTVALWDVSDRDTSLHGTVAQRLAAAELGTNGSIVLMHCGPNATPYLLRDLIAYYRGRGFRFVTIPTLLGVAWSPGQTRTVTTDEILGDLAPLAPSPIGGPITGPNGYSPSPSPRASASPAPTPAPSASPTAPAPSPLQTPTSSPAATASASPAVTPSVSPAASAAPTPAAPSPAALSPIPAATANAKSTDAATNGSRTLALGGVLLLAALALAAASIPVARSRRR